MTRRDETRPTLPLLFAATAIAGAVVWTYTMSFDPLPTPPRPKVRVTGLLDAELVNVRPCPGSFPGTCLEGTLRGERHNHGVYRHADEGAEPVCDSVPFDLDASLLTADFLCSSTLVWCSNLDAGWAALLRRAWDHRDAGGSP